MTLRSLRPSFLSNRCATRLAVALALGCAVSAPAHAFRLAHSRIVSAPDAPLQVLVGIADLTPDEQRSLMASLADPASWERAGVTPPVPLSSMTLRLEGGGSPTRRNLRITSSEAAKGSAVDMLLNVGTSEGQRQVQVSMMQSAGGFPGLTSQAQVGTGTRSSRGGAGAVAVRSGDTLYGIAQSNAVADATIYQMLVALWRANPNAFIQNNMNLVKAGATLVVPDAATVRAIDPAEARRIFIAQQEAYARYRASLAGAAARGTAASAGPAAAGQVGSSQSTVTPEPSPQDRVRLSSGEPGQGNAEAQAQTQGDARTSVAKATQDAQQRVDQLERNVKDLNDALAASRAAEQGRAGAAQDGNGRATGGANGQAGGIALPGFGGAAGSSGGSPSVADASGRSAAASGANGASSGSAASGVGSGAAGSAGASGAALGSGLNNAGGQSATGVGANGAANQASGAAQSGSQGSGQAGANRTDTAKPGISGDAANLGGTAGTSGTPGSSASAAGGASAQAGASGTRGTGITPAGSGSSAGAGNSASSAGAGSAASPAGAPGNPASAGAATGSGSAAIATDGSAASDDTGGAAKDKDSLSGLPSWLSDNLLIILTAVLALAAFVIAWLLRRAAARREEDQDDLDDELYMSEIDQGAIDRRLDGINLDLDEPPIEGDRRRPGPART